MTEVELFDHIESSISGFNRTKDRIKSTGEIFTPGKLVNEILDKLPSDCWDIDKTYLDPACGSGQFLLYVIYRKIKHGSTIEQAVQTTYGVDLMQDNIALCHSRVIDMIEHLNIPFCRDRVQQILNNNIVCHNALTYCYRFGNADDQPLEQSIGKCKCGICR